MSRYFSLAICGFIAVSSDLFSLLVRQTRQLTEGDLNSFEGQYFEIKEIKALRIAMASMVNHVRRNQDQSRAYADKLAETQEIERKSIAHELHDDTIQSLIAVTQSIDLAKNWFNTDSTRSAEMLQRAREQAIQIVTNLRNLIGGLRPPALEELGLIPALQTEVENISEVKVNLKIEGDQRRLPELTELILFRTTQEALRNVCRHSQAEWVDVSVQFNPNTVILQVQDNGIGFEPPTPLADLSLSNHYGLIGIQERVNSVGGTLNINSTLNKGTILTVSLPTTQIQHSENLVTDPGCHAQISPSHAYDIVTYEGTTFYFCCPVCQGAFQSNPLTYLKN